MKNQITFVQQRASQSQGTTLGMGNSIHLNLEFVLEISLQGSDECNLSREGARGLAWGHSSSMAEQVKELTLLLKFHHLPSPFLPLERKIWALLFAVAVPEKIISFFRFWVMASLGTQTWSACFGADVEQAGHSFSCCKSCLEGKTSTTAQIFASSSSSEGWTEARQRDGFSQGFLFWFVLWLYISQPDWVLFTLWINIC